MTRPVRPLQRIPMVDMAAAIGAANAGEPVVLMDEGGRPAAVVLSPAEYDTTACAAWNESGGTYQTVA